ncbi:MAG TPA: universal stress protein [Bacillota bacterium]|nr:universal stress protein [Bacillota bacterium]
MHKVLVATDGSRHSDKALRTVKDLLRMKPDLEVTVLCVTDLPNNLFNPNSPEMTPASFEYSSSEATRKLLSSADEFFSMDGFEVRTLSKYGHPATVICEVAQYEGFDLIVVGSRGLGAVKGLFMGSISSKVAHMSSCPVLIVK